MKWYYYLHINNDIIGKNPNIIQNVDFGESPFVRKYWVIDTESRKDAWLLVIEALYYGAKVERVKELATNWGLTKEDLLEFITRHKPNILQQEGMYKFIKNILLQEPKLFIAEARLANVTARQKTVEMKFTNATLRMWVDRVRNILPKEEGK